MFDKNMLYLIVMFTPEMIIQNHITNETSEEKIDRFIVTTLRKGVNLFESKVIKIKMMDKHGNMLRGEWIAELIEKLTNEFFINSVEDESIIIFADDEIGKNWFDGL